MSNCWYCKKVVGSGDEMVAHASCFNADLRAFNELHVMWKNVSGALCDASTVTVYERDYARSVRELTAERDAAIQERDTEREAIAAWIKPRPNEVDWPTEILLLATINSIRRGDHRNPEKIKGEKP